MMFSAFVNGSILYPNPDAILVRSSLLTGCIAGIDFKNFSLFIASFAISSNDFDCMVNLF